MSLSYASLKLSRSRLYAKIISKNKWHSIGILSEQLITSTQSHCLSLFVCSIKIQLVRKIRKTLVHELNTVLAEIENSYKIKSVLDLNRRCVSHPFECQEPLKLASE